MMWLFWSILIGFIVMIGMFTLLVLLGRRFNIFYWVTQSFKNSERKFLLKGKVDVLNDGSFMAVHKVGKNLLGTWSQQFLTPSKGKYYIMELEEYDTGRYRPRQSSHLIRNEVDIAQWDDKKGDYQRDASGKIVFKKDKLPIAVANSVTNDDIDFILKRKDLNKRMLQKKKEDRGWINTLIAGGVFVVVAIMMIFASYWNYQSYVETQKGVANALSQLSDEEYERARLEMIFEVLRNQRILEAQEVEPPQTVFNGSGT